MEPTAICEIIDSAKSPLEIIEKISGIKDEDFEITVLGSCQYGTIYSTYMALSTIYNMLKQEKGFESPTETQKTELIKETLEKLGITVKNFRVELKPNHIQQLKEKIYNHYGQEDFETYYLSEPKEEDEDTDNYEWDNCVKAYKEITSVDKFFEVARNSAWDLWTAIPEASEVLLPGVVVEYPTKPGVSSCYPLANMIQSNNYRLGIDMFILLTMGIVKSIECMCDFDT
jgi:hypothetical protein